MIAGLLVLVLCQLFGECAKSVLGLSIPGPIIGMFLLATILVVRRRSSESAKTPAGVSKVSGALIRCMGLLFVPAGVGILTVLPLLSGQWIATLVGLILSTFLSLVSTGLTMQWINARQPKDMSGG